MQTTAPAGLYAADYALWIAQQVSALRGAMRDGRLQDLDFENVVEELEGLARRDRLSLQSHLTTIAVHLLKLHYQPSMATRHWLGSVNVAATKIRRLLKASPSMNSLLAEFSIEAYADARRQAQIETGLPIETFPSSELDDRFAKAFNAVLSGEDFGGNAIVEAAEEARQNRNA